MVASYLFCFMALLTLLSVDGFAPIRMRPTYSQHSSESQLHHHHLNEISSIVTAVTDVDPSNFHPSFIQQTIDQTAQTFSYSFQSRLLGTILGNILAAYALKQITDFAGKLLNPPKPEPEPQRRNINSSEASSFKSAAKSLPPISGEAWLKLVFCIAIDVVSDSSFLLPGIGELEDVAWAPVSALLLKNLFASDRVAVAEFVKEILPFTDIIPLATTIWLFENVLVDTPANKLLGITSKRVPTESEQEK